MIIKTDRGFEIADDTGTLECESDSVVYKTHKDAQRAIDDNKYAERGFDELRALEAMVE